MSVAVGGTGDTPMAVDVEPGDFTRDGVITVAAADEEGPELPGFTPAGTVREVTVEGQLARPVTLTFPAGPDHADDLPLIWRHDPVEGWYPVAVGDAGTRAEAERTVFSPHLPGWLNPGNWVSSVGQWVRGRTDPPACQAPPAWADLTEPTLDILLTCATINRSGGATRVELKVRNNRGLTQEVPIPAGVAYADVEGQPELVRSLVRTLAGGRDIVLLPPGDEVRIGYTQPATSTEISVTPTVSPLSLAAELLLQLADLAGEQGSMAVLPALLNVAGCTGLKSELIAGVVPDSPGALENFAWGVVKCAGALADPRKAVAVAQSVVAAGADVPLSIVQADGSFRARVEKVAGRLNLLGKAGALVKIAEVGRLALTIWESNAEQLGRAFTTLDPAKVTLAMRGSAPVSSPVVARSDGFGAVLLGMTTTEVQAAVGSALLGSQEQGTCTLVSFRTSAGDAVAYIHAPEGTVLAIQAPDAAETDRGIGYGDNLDDLRAAYESDHAVEILETQAGGAAIVTTGDPSQVGFGNPGGLIGFIVNEDGEFESGPMVGGVPGFEYCSG